MKRKLRSKLIIVRSIVSYLCVCYSAICWNPCWAQTGQQQPTVDDQITFRHTLGAKLSGGASMSEFESSDGVTVTQVTHDFKTPRAAANSFRKEVKRAEKVIEHGALLDPTGKNIGDKMVVATEIFYPRGSGFELFYTYGPSLIILSPPSLRHLRLFAKRSGL
jgi:hypothetical protein